MIDGNRVQAQSEHAPAAAEEMRLAEGGAPRAQQIVVWHVLKRMRVLARRSILWHRQLQQSSQRITRLHAQLDRGRDEKRLLQDERQLLRHENRRLQEEVASLRPLATQLAALLHSRVFRLAQALRSIRLFLIPRGSLRERLAVGGFRVFFGRPADSAQASTKDAPAAVVSAQPAADPPAPANLATADDENLDFADERPEWLDLDDDGELCYSPLSWQLKAKPQRDTQFINLVILSPVHRSGSTLLQRICNSRKGTLIWGEHGGLLAHFADIYVSAAYFSTMGRQERTDYFGQGQNPNLWIADMCPELDYVQAALVESARVFLHTFYGQCRERYDILGFKEVHYGREEVELLRACCPQAEILFLVRNPLDAWKSTPRDWYLSLDEWTERWTRNVRHLLSFASADVHCRLLRYEDLVRQETKTMSILADVAKVSPQQVSTVLAHKIGSINMGISEPERAVILQRCREPMTTLGYS